MGPLVRFRWAFAGFGHVACCGCGPCSCSVPVAPIQSNSRVCRTVALQHYYNELIKHQVNGTLTLNLQRDPALCACGESQTGPFQQQKNEPERAM